MQPLLIADLFSGAGGISHGFAQAGFKVICGVDFDSTSVDTFARNHPEARAVVADLSSMDPAELAETLGVQRGELDCMSGGPPCQGFSRNRAFRHQDGVFVDDPRNHLYWHFFEFIKYFRPKTVVMENVPEILIKANGSFKEAVFERFSRLGYRAEAQVLNAAHFGVPQHRRRAIFLAGRDDIHVQFPKPGTALGPRPGRRTPTSPELIRGRAARQATAGLLPLDEFRLPTGPTVWEAISDLSGSYASSLQSVSGYSGPPRNGYQLGRRDGGVQVTNHFRWPLSSRQLERIRLLGEGQGFHHLPEELKVRDGYGSAYRRLQKEAQALTITTWMFHPGSGMFTHPNEDRVITIREAARLQSFQDDFVFLGRYHAQCRQVGNAVAPLVAYHIACEVQRALGVGAAQHGVRNATINREDAVGL